MKTNFVVIKLIAYQNKTIFKIKTPVGNHQKTNYTT